MSGDPTAKPRIVWDLDDTLNELTRHWLESLRTARPGLALPGFGGLVDNPPHRLCGLDLQDYLASLDQFRLCPAFASLAPRPELLEWFQRNGDAFEHHVLTARPTRTVAAGSSWVFTHFGRWVRHFHFVPAARPDDLAPDSGAGKECLLRQIGCVDFMVDDSAGNLKACAPLVGRGILVPQPWNGGDHGITAVLGDLPVASH